jgi:hypothetical protein
MPKPHSIHAATALAGLVAFVATACADRAPVDALVSGTAGSRMDASERTTCWLTERGAMRCNGALLRGTSSAKDGAFVKVSVGGDVACGLREDGTARCFVGWVDCDQGLPCILGGTTSRSGRGRPPRSAGSYVDLDVEPSGSAARARQTASRAPLLHRSSTGTLVPDALVAGGL